jgi:magnesium-transporting ATPase (P-type)
VTSLSCNGAAILRPEPKGSRTEIALLQFLEKCGIDYELEREIKLVNAATYKFPFSSARKRMGIVLEYEGNQRLFEKGGSDKITAVCTHFYKRSTDEIIPIDENLKNKIDEAIKTMAD